jgi:hypothetical protein
MSEKIPVRVLYHVQFVLTKSFIFMLIQENKTTTIIITNCHFSRQCPCPDGAYALLAAFWRFHDDPRFGIYF